MNDSVRTATRTEGSTGAAKRNGRRRWWPWRRGGDDNTKPPRRVWVQNVDANVGLLDARLKAIRARREVAAEHLLNANRPGSARHRLLKEELARESAVDAQVAILLDRARNAANRREPVPSRFWNWWGGRLIEAAYQNLHAAEALLAEIYDWEDLKAEIPEAVARVAQEINRDDPRRRAADALLVASPEAVRTLEATRATVRKTIEIGHAAGDRDHSRLRSFRNAILVAAALIGLLVIGFVAYVHYHPGEVPLCFAPTPEGDNSALWVCPTGQFPLDVSHTPPGGPTAPDDIFIVTLLGLLGGSFSAALAIRNLTGTSTPYDVPLALAALKAPLGALTAIGGLIALQGDFVPGLSELDSQGQILAYSLVFGYAQQILSGLIDRRAESILSSAPGKDRPIEYGDAGRESLPPAPTGQGSPPPTRGRSGVRLRLSR